MPVDFNHFLQLGSGIYTLPDIASILQLPASKVRRWLREYWNERFAHELGIFSEGEGKELATNFLTLIEFFVFYQLRQEGIPAQKIARAHEVLSSAFQTKYPFAQSDILTDGKNVLFSGQAGEIIQADPTLQITIREVIAPFAKKIEFNTGHMAAKFFPLGKNHSIVVDPRRQFGQPVFENSNVLAETVSELYKGGESIETIMDMYDLSHIQIEDAIYFYNQAA